MTAEDQPRLSRFCVTSPVFSDLSDGIEKRVVFSARSGARRLIDEGTWHLLECMQATAVDADRVADLLEAEILVPTREDELAVVVRRLRKGSGDTLRLVINPSSMCQLACTYCGQGHRPGVMSDVEQDRLIGHVAAKLEAARYIALQVGWFGAEPLLGMQVIRSLTPRLRDVATAHGCTYRAGLVTNGLALSAGIATELVGQLGIRSVEVTLDGSADVHDRRRGTKAGKGTFAAIYSNMLSLAHRDDLQVALSVRCNVDSNNAGGVSDLIETMAGDGLQGRIDHFYLAPVHDYANGADRASLSLEEFAEWEMGLLALACERGFNVALIPQPVSSTCMATERESELIDSDGTLYNCTEVAMVPAYGSPANRFAIGSLKDGELKARRAVLGRLIEEVSQGEHTCSACPLLPVCGGACPKAWLEGKKPCPSYKHNMGDRLLLRLAADRRTVGRPLGSA